METNILEATYSSLIDNVEKQTGSLYSVWDVLPKDIPDPNAKNPEDRDDEEVTTDADMRHLSSLLERMSSFVSGIDLGITYHDEVIWILLLQFTLLTASAAYIKDEFSV